MGNRSNVNLVKINAENGKFVGVTSYSHWGGVEHQIVALAALIKAARHNDAEYGFNTILANILSYSGNGIGGGINPFSVDTVEDAYSQQLDNEHPILNINFGHEYNGDHSEIVVFDDYSKESLSFPFSEQGAARAARFIIRKEIARYDSEDVKIMGLTGRSNVNSIVKAAENYVKGNMEIALNMG